MTCWPTSRCCLSEAAARKLSEALAVMNVYEVIRRPIVTEKGGDQERRSEARCALKCSRRQQDPDQGAVQKVFKVKVADVRTVNNAGKLRRRGRFSGYRSDWKKAYVRLEGGRKDAGVHGDLSHGR